VNSRLITAQERTDEKLLVATPLTAEREATLKEELLRLQGLLAMPVAERADQLHQSTFLATWRIEGKLDSLIADRAAHAAAPSSSAARATSHLAFGAAEAFTDEPDEQQRVAGNVLPEMTAEVSDRMFRSFSEVNCCREV
jgi:hypothetical protein